MASYNLARPATCHHANNFFTLEKMSLPGAAPMMGGNDVSQEQMMAMQNEQMKDFLKSYNKTTQVRSPREKKCSFTYLLKGTCTKKGLPNVRFQLCFNDCVRNFSASALTEEEQECGRKCVGKYLEYSARVAQQFMKRNSQQ